MFHSRLWYLKMENVVVMLARPLFNEHYVDNSIARKKNEADKLFNFLNSYHKYIKLLK